MAVVVERRKIPNRPVLEDLMQDAIDVVREEYHRAAPAEALEALLRIVPADHEFGALKALQRLVGERLARHAAPKGVQIKASSPKARAEALFRTGAK